MLRQILWEVRKMVLRRSFLILAAISLLAVGFLTFQTNQYTKESLPNWGYGEEYQALQTQYQGLSDTDFEKIRTEQEALLAAHPELYEGEYPDGKGGTFLAENRLGIAQSQFLYRLDPAEQILYPYYIMSNSYVKESGDELDRYIRQAEGTYGARLLQKQKEWLSVEAGRTILPPPGGTGFSVMQGLFPFSGDSSYSLLFTAFLIIMACAPIYTREYQSDMAPLLLTSKRGRRQTLWAKIAAPILVSAGLALVLQMIQLLMYSLFFPACWGASFASLQYQLSSFAPLGIVEAPIWQVYLLFLGLRVLGAVIFGLLISLFSAISRNFLTPIGAGVLIFAFPFLLSLLPETVYDTVPQILDHAGKGLEELARWLQIASPAGSLAAGELGIWFGYYLNFFGWPVPCILVAALAPFVFLIPALFTPYFFRRCNVGRAHLRKEAHHADCRKRHQAV